MSAKGHRKGAGKAATVTSLAGSESKESPVGGVRQASSADSISGSEAFEALAPGLAPDALRKRELLEELLERVPEPKSRRMIRSLLSGMTLKEIADAEKVPDGTVKWRIHALRKKLSILKNNSNLSGF